MTPPGGSSTPCTRLCDRFADGCPGNNQVNGIVRELCNEDCESVDSDPACASVVATAISCVGSLPGLCTEDGPTDASTCSAAYAAALACTEDDDGGPNEPMTGCTTAGGCECGDDTCLQCRCVLPGSATCDVLCE